MKKKMLITSVALITLVAMLAGVPVFAKNTGNPSNLRSGNSVTANKTVKNLDSFSDVPSTHWAYEAVGWMLENNIAQGSGDGKFLPDKLVTREEYAKMMVLTLGLEIKNPETATFQDVKKGGWQYKYIETAKWYVTVYKTSDGLYYYPQRQAVREDMAVALVKALKLDISTADLSVLNEYTDSGDISEKLKSYMAVAVKNGLISGYTDSAGKKVLAPGETLTRAQSAVLLYNAFKKNEEKITLDGLEEKDTYEGALDTVDTDADGDYDVPAVTAVIKDGGVLVSWNKIDDSRFTGYKVVVSKSNASPKYPDDGYIEYITDRERTSRFIQNGDTYNGGDVGTIQSGVTYYFSITALYGDKKVAGNAIQLTMP
jgi:hypothetical protein